MKLILLLSTLFLCENSWAQKTEEFDVTFEQDVTVQGKLEVNSTTQSSKPCPAMTETQRNAIVSPASGSCVYNTNTLTLNIYNGTIWKSAGGGGGGGGISNWETALNYAINDVVIESNKIYQCNTAHTSTVFASDIANWTLISGTNASEASGALVMAASNWTSRNASAENEWSSVTYGNGLFVAVALSGTGNRVMTSPDGITWTARTSAADNFWYSVTYGNGLFVAVASSGTGNRVMTSPDGITWTARTSAADNSWRSVTYGKGLFVAVASSGTGNRVMTSLNSGEP
jgi:hypothetical protein